jgi:hypothetical protein
MKYFRITCETPYCGTTMEDYFKAETIEEAEDYAEELSRQNAEGYEYLVSGWDNENFEDLTEEEQQDELDNYYADCMGVVEEISYEEYCEETGDYE